MENTADGSDFARADGIDVIGDVHGHADRLEALLASMGYSERRGAWRHPARKAVFVGDLVDRGPRQLDTVGIARRMVDAGEAMVVLGNHELNAIGFATACPRRPRHLRERTPKNSHQCAAFVAAVGLDSPLHRELVDWFAGLPVWLEVAGIRVVHACWHAPSVAAFPTGRLDRDRLPDFFAYVDGEPVGETVPLEILTKGPEVDLPPGESYRDAEGTERSRTRIAWWLSRAASLGEMALVGHAAPPPMAKLPPASGFFPAPGDPLTFIGHYWLGGEPALVSDDVVCCDFSVAKDGVLAAYRWDAGETRALPGRFAWA